MSKNNTIRKSDKKFIRLQKARIRSQFLDVKKQEELISQLYQQFSGQAVTVTSAPEAKIASVVSQPEKPKKEAKKTKKEATKKSSNKKAK